ncbi:MAG: sugar ABC transporter permease YjfF, partial [Rhizobacter sp.]|nr:sugar ABC transporter permease YjfF [Rhizobacter sp.]
MSATPTREAMPLEAQIGQRAPGLAAAPVRMTMDPKYLPLSVTIALFFAMATVGSVAYTGFFS